LTLLLRETVGWKMMEEVMKTNEDYALEVQGLRKSYGKITAVNGIDLAVRKGEIFGLIGPNGAGKSTTIECALGTRKRDAGTVSVLGMDPERDRKRLFAQVGVQFQQTAYPEKIRVREACEVAAALYPKTRDWEALLERFGLADKRKGFVKDLSGGERQRLSVALALIPDPEIVFLDELTTGLDPKSRRDIWAFLEELKESGTTIVLTSHYMDEVERLCDRIAILKAGSVTAQGTPEELMKAHGAKNLEDVFLEYMERDDDMEEK
jgi:ABC-2 type transport system ATP-binding protein